MTSTIIQAVAHTEPFSPGSSPCTATLGLPDPGSDHVPPPPIDARTPGQRGHKIWIRPFYCQGVVMRRREFTPGYLKVRHLVGRDSDGWISLRMATLDLSAEEANSGGDKAASAADPKEGRPATDDEYVWIIPFWSGGFAVPTANLATGLLDVPLRTKISSRGQVTFEHCLDPRRDWLPGGNSRELHRVRRFSVTGPDDLEWAHHGIWHLNFEDIPLQRTEPGIGLWDDPHDPGYAMLDDPEDPYGCCAACYDRIMGENEDDA